MSKKVKLIEGGICAPKGFQSAAISCGIKNPAVERLDLALIYSAHPTVGSAVYTQNQVCAAPVRLSSSNLKTAEPRAIIVNSVKCLPPQNKPTPAEIMNCRPFFEKQLDALPDVRVIVALGRIAHDAVLRAAGVRLAAHPFGHGAVHRLADGRHLVDSYHCSRYNTNTGRLTPEMFGDVFRTALALRDQTSGPNSSIKLR